jgi:hypothetical protein
MRSGRWGRGRGADVVEELLLEGTRCRAAACEIRAWHVGRLCSPSPVSQSFYEVLKSFYEELGIKYKNWNFLRSSSNDYIEKKSCITTVKW